MQNLEDAYRNTKYEADTELGKIEIRIGYSSNELDGLLILKGVKSWAFITAWNPESKPSAFEENKRRNEELLRMISNSHWTIYGGRGVPNNLNWEPEESFLVLGISRDDALSLGQELSQNAIVFGVAEKAAELLWCFN